MTETKEYSEEQLAAIYRLGRLYYESGYFAPAERIFSGLAAVDEGQTSSRLGLGLVKLELGLYEEAARTLGQVAQGGKHEFEAKLALCGAFLGRGEGQRARSLLTQIRAEHGQELQRNGGYLNLWRAFSNVC